jgi:hypothetical protein
MHAACLGSQLRPRRTAFCQRRSGGARAGRIARTRRFGPTFLQHGVAALPLEHGFRYADCYARTCASNAASVDLDADRTSPMKTTRDSKTSALRGSRSEAGHRKLARYATILAAVAAAIAIAAVLARFVDW